MRVRIRMRRTDRRDTQLHKIRDLMFAASRRGAWMTLGEIARLTDIGEASVSAQLRHLRKRRHGRHRVEKRRRVARTAVSRTVSGRRRRLTALLAPAPLRWEYRVLPRRRV